MAEIESLAISEAYQGKGFGRQLVEACLKEARLLDLNRVFTLTYVPNFFLKLGTRYYDYDYTGSGNPLGAPVKIADATALDTLNAVVDKVWLGYLSINMRW